MSEKISRKRREFLKFLGLFGLGFLGAKLQSSIPSDSHTFRKFKVVETSNRLEIYSKNGKKILTIDKNGIVVE